MYNICKFYDDTMYFPIFFLLYMYFLNEKVPDIKVFRLISGIIVYLWLFVKYWGAN